MMPRRNPSRGTPLFAVILRQASFFAQVSLHKKWILCIVISKSLMAR